MKLLRADIVIRRRTGLGLNDSATYLLTDSYDSYFNNAIVKSSKPIGWDKYPPIIWDAKSSTPGLLPGQTAAIAKAIGPSASQSWWREPWNTTATEPFATKRARKAKAANRAKKKKKK